MSYINGLQGQDADRATTTAQPVLIGGTDGFNTYSSAINQFGDLSVKTPQNEVFFARILAEQMVTNYLLSVISGSTDDLEQLRASFLNQVTGA